MTIKPLRGEITVPGDKSISHRSIMFGALAKGTTRVRGFLRGADCLSTIDCFRALGIRVDSDREEILVHGKGLHGLTVPSRRLDCGNSGTTTRLISGILSAQPFTTELTGDASIRKRPMGPDHKTALSHGCRHPKAWPETAVRLCGSAAAPLHGIHYESPVASAP